MAANLPEKLRTAEISRFALRAAQLEKIKPIISYWCDYWIVQQILSNSLHTQDDDCLVYTTNLMDKLEQVKTENATNDAIQDDVAAQAYVEQFGLETFNRADSVVRANKVSPQTADTFKAAATFLDLLQIFGQLDSEVAAKSKYAKYHALRIAKAVKAGEDPNLSNPKAPPQPTVEDASDADPNDPDVQMINGAMQNPPTTFNSAHPQASPTVSPVVAPVASGSAAVSPYPGQVSPGVPSEKVRSNSVGGGYFPTAPPTFTPEAAEPNLPTAPEIPSVPSNIPSAPAIPHDLDPSSFYNTASAPPPMSPPAPAPAPTSASLHSTRQHIPPPQTPIAPPVPSIPSAPPFQPSSSPAIANAPPFQALSPPESYRTDEESIISAQKHAKWAMSALTFEDVDTAVKELRIALQSLGAK